MARGEIFFWPLLNFSTVTAFMFEQASAPATFPASVNEQSEPPPQALIVRQAIVDMHGDVAGYELFGRSRAPHERLSSNDVGLVFAAIAHAAGDEPCSMYPVFVKCSHESIASGQLELVSTERVVLEIEPLGHVATSEVLARTPLLRTLRERGFQLSFGHMVLESAYAEWLPLADYIKFDVSVLRPEQIAFLTRYAERSSSAQLIAEKVEDEQQYQMLQGMGFTLFQGFWFARPALVEPRMIAPAQANIIQLINLLRQQAHPDAIEEVLKKDAGLAFNLMRLINSAGLGLTREITSFRQAVLILGVKKLFRWAALLFTASRFGNLPASVGKTAVVRGRMMELLALELWGDHEADLAFVVGVFSLLDVMLRMPMCKALELVQVPEAVTSALLHNEGELGGLLQLAKSCESMGAFELDRSSSLSRLNAPQINTAHLQALAWTENLAT